MTALALLCLACGSPPQKKDEVALVYRAAFRAEAGVSTKVVFPWIADGTAFEVQQALSVTDGGTWAIEDSPEGVGLAVTGFGNHAVTFNGSKVKGLEASQGIPAAALTRLVPDGGPGERYFKVNKGGTALVNVDFEYTAIRDCGAGCGGTRSWTYLGPVGLSVQTVSMEFSEATR